MIPYCTADGAGPYQPVDWLARTAEVGSEQADAERVACSSHVVRNGNPPVNVDGALLCPECLAPVLLAESAPAWQFAV